MEKELYELNKKFTELSSQLSDKEIELLDMLEGFDPINTLIEKLKTDPQNFTIYFPLLQEEMNRKYDQEIENIKKEANKEKIKLTALLSNKTKTHKTSIKAKSTDQHYEGDNMTDIEKFKYRPDGNYPPYTFKRKGVLQDYKAYHSRYLRCPYNCVECPRTTIDKAKAHLKICKKNPKNENNKKYVNNPVCPDIDQHYKNEILRQKEPVA